MINDDNKFPEPVVLRAIELLAVRLGRPIAEQRVRDFVALVECFIQAAEEHDDAEQAA